MYMDDQIGCFFVVLEVFGMVDNMYVFFIVDYGFVVGYYGLFGKQNMYQYSVCVLLIISGFGVFVGE